MKKQTRFIESWFLTIGYTFYLALSYGLFYMVYFSPIKAKDDDLSLFGHFIYIFMLICLPTLCFIFLIHRGASIIEISEDGIKKSLFKIFYKREIKWEELTEMRIVYRVNAWLFASKVSMGKFNYNQLVKRKDTIQMTMSKELYDAIREYSNQEIIGLKDETVN